MKIIRQRFGNLDKLVKVLIVMVMCFTMLFTYNEPVSAERVYGVGSPRIGMGPLKSYNFLDTTVKVPLGRSWSYNISGAPIDKGLSLTNYRLHFGSGRTINGFSDQRYMMNTSSKVMEVANPFQATYSSSYGTVSSAVEMLADNTGNTLYWGTSDGRIGRLHNFGLEHYGGQQEVLISPQIPSMSAVTELANPSLGKIWATSSSKISLYDVLNSKETWYYTMADLTTTSGRFSGITTFTTGIRSGDANNGMIVTDNGLNEGYGLIYQGIADSTRTGWQRWSTKIVYNAGIPKHAAFDHVNRKIYAIDREGRFYIHNESGQIQFTSFKYAGDSSTRGFDSVGGVLLTDDYAYVSTLGSTQSLTSKGTITRFNKSNPDIKSVYVHEAAVTTTPVYVSGLVYFGDANGKVWALNPDTMQLVNWYLDETLTSPVLSYDIGAQVKYILGADNHLIAASDSNISGFKGRPDFIVSSIKNSSGAQIGGSRYNFTTSTLPEISFTNEIQNIGTFDYNYYNEFGGKNHQKTTFEITNLDNSLKVPITSGNIVSSNIEPSIYKSEMYPNDPLYFQVGSGTTATQSYKFTPSTEGEYEIKVTADADLDQIEFKEDNNTKTAVIDVVDMRLPSASSNKSSYRPNETVAFTLSKYQTYSYSSYSFQVLGPDGLTAYSNSGTAFPSSLSTANTTKLGTYKYKLDVINRYGNTLSTGWKTFSVGNNPPVANFSVNKASFYISESAQITNLASDPDGDSFTVQYEVTRPDGTKYTDSTLNPTISSLQRGTYTVKQTVTDAYNATDSISKTFSVVNRPPVAGFNTNKLSYYNDESVSVISTATDPDGDSLSYSYEVTAPNGTKQTFSQSNPVFSSSQIGTYTIKQTVYDGYGGSDTVSKTINVLNRPPIAGFNTSKSTYKDNENVCITSAASDPDGQTLTFSYEITRPDGTKFTLTTASPCFGSLQVGTYTIKQTVTDPYNSSSTVTKTVIVEKSNLPPVAGFNFNKTKYYKGEAIVITSTATDPNGDALTYLYEITRPDGTKFTSTSANPSFTASSTGTYIVKQTVTDPFNEMDSITKTQWVQTLPTPGFTTNKTSYYKNEAVTVTSSAFDEDGGALTYLYEVTDPNGVKKTYSIANPVIPLSSVIGTYSIKQTVTDDEGDTATITKSITVVNRPPVANFNFNKTSYYKNETISITNAASDPDNDILTYQYVVTKPSGGTLTLTTASPSFLAEEVGTYSVKQTVTDVNGAIAQATKTTLVVNRPPVAGFNTDKTSYYVTDSIKVTSTATDPDSDVLTYFYEVTNPKGTTVTSTLADPTFSNLIVGTYTIKQTVKDPYGATSITSKTVNVINRPPVASFSFSPTTIYNDTNVGFVDSSSDPDGDVLTYQWAYQQPGGTSWIDFSTAKNPSKILNVKGTWGIRLTVTDPHGATATTTKNPVVINRTPQATISYTPSNPFEGDQVNVCVVPTDPDNDLLTVKIFVKKDGGAEQNVLSITNVRTNEQHCYSFIAQPGRYDLRTTVNDGTAESSASTWFNAKPLNIKGAVKHTPDWLVKHQEIGNAPQQFYSGEKFLLEADTSPYPIVYVKSTLKAVQAEGNQHSATVPLNRISDILYKGELYNEAYLKYPTNLKVGNHYFEFEVKYGNGVIKKDVVSIEIISDTFEAYQLHRRY